MDEITYEGNASMDWEQVKEMASTFGAGLSAGIIGARYLTKIIRGLRSEPLEKPIGFSERSDILRDLGELRESMQTQDQVLASIVGRQDRAENRLRNLEKHITH